MARGTVSLSEEEGGAIGNAARNGALNSRGRQELNESHQFLQLAIGKLKTGHARSRDPFADQFTQTIDCASAGIICSDNVWSSLPAFTIDAVTGGEVRLEVSPPRFERIRIPRLRSLCCGLHLIRSHFKPNQTHRKA